MNNQIEWVVLTKAPVAGLVKTRLIPSLGEQAALDLYLQLLVRLEKTLKQVSLNTDSQVALWIAGNMEHEAFEGWQALPFNEGNISFYQQDETGDLGDRMEQAVQSSLLRGCIPVLIGVDVPELTESYLLNCLKQLKDHDLVISPAEDGGYGLLGMKQFHSELFTNKAWGTDSVFAQTLANLEALKISKNMSFETLPEVWDVDELADVERFRLIQLQ